MVPLLASRLVGPHGRVDSIEPNPSSAARLRRTLADNRTSNVFAHQCGLSDEPGALTLSIPDINSGEATLAPSQYPDGTVEHVEVEVRRGDDVVKADPRLKLIKIDVEGFECRVLDGLQRTLTVVRPMVITEVISEHLRRAGFTVEDLVDRMTAYQYRPLCMGTRRRGLRHVLQLERMSPGRYPNGDLVWVHMAAHRRFLSALD